MKRVDWPLGLVVAGVVLLVGSAVGKWLPGLILGTALVLGTLAATRRRREADRPESDD